MITFYQAIACTPAPHAADKSALGTLPVRGYRHCEPLRQATGFGLYCYPPCALAFEFDGTALQVWLRDEALGALDPGEAVQLPEAAAGWDARAPAALRGCLYPLLARSAVQPNMVQLWTGWLIRTSPEWGALIRPPANLPRPAGYDLYEGFIETDVWAGPLFVNLALTKTDTCIALRPEWPLCQVQPIPRAALTQKSVRVFAHEWTEEVWARYQEHVVVPARDPDRHRGAYAIRARQRPPAVWATAGPDGDDGREGQA